MAGLEMIEMLVNTATANAYRPTEDLHGDPGCVAMEEDTFKDISRAHLEAHYAGE